MKEYKDDHALVAVGVLSGLAGMFIGSAVAWTVLGTLGQSRRDWRESYMKLEERYKTMAEISAKEIDHERASLRAKDAEIAALRSSVAARAAEKR